MTDLPLSNGQTAIIDDADAELAAGYKWWSDHRGYVTAYVPGSGRGAAKLSLHRLITDPPDGLHVDHINGNRLDNRRRNLRVCTPSQNQMNQQRVRGKSRYKGVYWSKKAERWYAAIRVEGKKKWLGGFDKELEAARAYDAAAREHYGEFAWTNCPKLPMNCSPARSASAPTRLAARTYLRRRSPSSPRSVGCGRSSGRSAGGSTASSVAASAPPRPRR